MERDNFIRVLAVLLAVPDNENDSHIRLLSQVARRLVQESFREKVLAVQDAGRLYECFREVEQN